MHSFRHRTENDADLSQLVLVGGRHRHAVENDIDRDAGQRHALVQRYAKLLEGAQQFRIDLVHAFQLRLLLGCSVIADRLEIDLRIVDIGPLRLLHLEPRLVRLESELEQPLRFALLGRNHPDGVFTEPFRRDIGLDVGDETVPVGLVDEILQCCAHDVVPKLS